LRLSFEVVYGHAFNPPPRAGVAPRTEVSLDAMRAMVRSGRARS
jgi:malonyl-CoA O-methyltransferase